MIFEREEKCLSLAQFEALTCAKWNPQLEFASQEILLQIQTITKKLHKKGELTLEQLWLGQYYRKEISTPPVPDVSVRWIGSDLGWGVFALRPLRKGQFIAQYSGKVRKRARGDDKNAYCFEYIASPGAPTPYLIDAQDQGGLGRYLNHSAKPNLLSSIVTLDHVSYVIFHAKEPIAAGEQLCYDYGEDYWSKRRAPSLLSLTA